MTTNPPIVVPSALLNVVGATDLRAEQLAAVGVTHVVPAETDRQITRQDHGRDIAVCAGSGCADERYVGDGFEKQARVLGLADRVFINEHDDFAARDVALSFRSPRMSKITAGVLLMVSNILSTSPACRRSRST